MSNEDWYGENTATFGDRLEAARESCGLSQTELAQRLGVRDTTIKSWEADEWEPRGNRLQMLAGMLNVSLMWLLSGRGEGVAHLIRTRRLRCQHAAHLPILRGCVGKCKRSALN
ncbi:helix-turn-helix domain-containing protein [Cypionkella sp.]|uniref:helix-turn-helix domain-containing protein n=1 Tax=Cypionkella sp. TaxID=2811411 RepID=UPI0034585404